MHIEQPILVMAMPRSGSSMLTGIIHRHNVWVGHCNPGNKRNPRGYFENIHLKQATREWMGGINWDAKIIPFREGWRDRVAQALERQSYPEGARWVYKDSALKWKMWGEFDPWWIKCRRDHESVFRSCRQCSFPDPRLSAHQLHERIKLHDRVMDEIPGVDVYTPDLVAGNYRQLRQAFDYLQLDLDTEIVDDFVIDEAWHYSEVGS